MELRTKNDVAKRKTVSVMQKNGSQAKLFSDIRPLFGRTPTGREDAVIFVRADLKNRKANDIIEKEGL